MSLRAELEKSGGWLFRYRGFLPLLVLPFCAAGFWSYSYLGGSHALTEGWGLACVAVSIIGQGVRSLAVGFAAGGTSGRNTRHQRAPELNTKGIYSLVRHPLYLGNYLVLVGFMMFFRNGWLLLVVSSVYALYYERIMLAEEAFLRGKFGPQFEAWADKTPAFIPRLRGWVRPERRFCWRTVLRREYSGVFLITTVFAILDTLGDSRAERRWHLDPPWVAVFGAGLLFYLTFRSLKKYTRVLHAEGR